MDLFKRLAMRDHCDPPAVLGTANTTGIILQCIEGICHLHMGPKVVHRDLKPENIITSAKLDGTIGIQIADFDIAVVGEPGVIICSGKVGTFPFMAPEVVLADHYHPFLADIWSMGFVIIEVACRLNVVKRSLNLLRNRTKSRWAQDVVLMKKIQAFFSESENVNQLIESHVQADMNAFSDDLSMLLSGMLAVNADERWTAQELRARSDSFFSQSPTEPEGGDSQARLTVEPEGTGHPEEEAVCAEPDIFRKD